MSNEPLCVWKIAITQKCPRPWGTALRRHCLLTERAELRLLGLEWWHSRLQHIPGMFRVQTYGDPAAGAEAKDRSRVCRLFCKGPEAESSRLCGPYGLCHTPSFCHCSTKTDTGNTQKTVRLCPSKTSFSNQAVTGFGPQAAVYQPLAYRRKSQFVPWWAADWMRVGLLVLTALPHGEGLGDRRRWRRCAWRQMQSAGTERLYKASAFQGHRREAQAVVECI